MLSFVKSQPTPGDVHVNRPLTNMLVAFMQNPANFAADQVAPNISGENQSNLFWSIPRGAFNRSELKKRAPGTRSAQLGYSTVTDSYFCDVIAGHVPVEDQVRGNADSPLNMDRQAVSLISQQALLYREIDFATKFLTTGVWTTDLTPSIKWDQPTSTPIQDIEAGLQSVLLKTGFEPNTLVLDRKSWGALKNNAQLIGRVSGGSNNASPAQMTKERVATLLGVERIIVSNAIKNTAKEGQSDVNAFVAGDNALLLYVAPDPGIMVPSAIYGFTWNRMGTAGPGGQRIKRFRQEDVESDIVELQMAYVYKLISADLGYFLPDTIT